MDALSEFIRFFRSYIHTRILQIAHGFEHVKDVIVAILVVKRGKYSSSFLNTSFFVLVATVFIGGPTIAENNPFLQSLEGSGASSQGAVVSYNPYENSLLTNFSIKPRSEVVKHAVAEGETIGTIAERYQVSADSVKWANNLKSDSIKAGQTLDIPPVTGIVHKVVSGENIYTIAKKYRTDPQKIVNFPFNDFIDLDTFSLASGQTLYVPDGVIEAAKPVAPRVFAPIQAGVQGTSNFIWPTSGTISQNPIWYHMALDIANRALPPVIAADSGTVVYSGCLKYGYGCHVIIDHGNGYRTLYGHLSQLGVSVGQNVGQGQQIGILGSTGKSTGPHLHFEVRSGSTLLNPLNFLR